MNNQSSVRSLHREHLSSSTGFLMLFIKRFLKECVLCMMLFAVSLLFSGILANKFWEMFIDTLSIGQYSMKWFLASAACQAASEIVTYIGKILYASILPKIEMNIRLSLFAYVQNLSIHYFEKIDPGILENTIDNASEGTREALEDIITEILPSLIFLLIANIYLCILNPLVGILYTISSCFFMFLYYYLAKNGFQKGQDASKITNLRTGKVVEMLQNIKLTKIFNLENYCLDKVKQVSKTEANYLKSCFTSSAQTGFISGCVLLLCNTVIISIILIIIYVKLSMTPGQLIAIMFTFFSTSWYLWSASKQVMDVILNLSRVSQSLHRLYKAPESKISGYDKSTLIQNIEIKNLTFKIGNSVLFKNLSINIPQGKKICIMGQSGSGKSTLLSILTKLHEVDDNKVFINNLDINKIDPSYYRSQISYISQSHDMFHASIFENIAIGKKHVSREEVIKAAQIADIHDFIMTLPDDYNYNVGVGNSMLSGGQIQRICIARALINRGHIKFCDEPVSALDKASSVEIIKNIINEFPDDTLICVDHSASISPFMDLILYFYDGDVIIDTHENLLRNNEMYRNMFVSTLVF